jgi:metallo-beta-lactamase family protein
VPEILFHGAAGEVTGSMHLIRANGHWVALDCGLFQGRRAESEAKNRQWPLPPREISAVVLSHAHIDHSGRLPRLVKDGFEGPIYCTPATRDLCAIMLPDSAHIQEEDLHYLNKRRARKGLEPVQPLYEYSDVVATLRLFQSISHGRWFSVVPGLLARFNDAGHMLGSAGIHLEFAKRNGNTASLYYTGDVGRFNSLILRDPAPFPEVDTLLCESTYGGRKNESIEEAKEQFIEAVRRTIARGGKVIIPSFAVGRTQTVVYALHEAMVAGTLPRIPVFVDSPLAVNATEVFKLHPECYDVEARAFHRVTGDILGGGCCTYIRNLEESKALHERRSPCIIISASGMCETGRIQHHIKNNIESPRNLILFPGYQAEHTLGRKLVDGARTINLFHEQYTVRAEVIQIHGFSAHADQAELLKMLEPLRRRVRRIYLIHGEAEQTGAFEQKLRQNGFDDVIIARRDQRDELLTN